MTFTSGRFGTRPRVVSSSRIVTGFLNLYGWKRLYWRQASFGAFADELMGAVLAEQLGAFGVEALLDLDGDDVLEQAPGLATGLVIAADHDDRDAVVAGDAGLQGDLAGLVRR